MRKLIIIISIIAFIITISYVGYVKREIFSILSRPFLNLYGVKDDGTEELTDIVFITHPFSTEDTEKTYQEKKAEGYKFLGMTSYSEFPGSISNPFDRFSDVNDSAWKHNYSDIVDGWCHCFRYPENYIKGNKPQILLSESDFSNYEIHKPSGEEKEYDFLYVCLKDNEECLNGWQSYNRNWEIAKQMLRIMCDDFGLRGLLIGRINCDIPRGCHNLMELTDFQDYNKFIKNYNKCRFLFVPNITDASPRVVTEAMCYNLPIFMNIDILGGWKYVIPDETGDFFNNDIGYFKPCLESFLDNLFKGVYHPRDFFIRNYGPENSGKRLLKFVESIYGPKPYKYMKPGV